MARKSKNKERRPHASNAGNDNKQDDNLELEDRFATAETRPQFRSVKKSQSKVVLDDRFSSVLTDPRFQLEGTDKYGRKNKKGRSAATKEELSAFYTIDDKKEADQKNQPTNNKVDDDSGSSESDSDSSQEPKKTAESKFQNAKPDKSSISTSKNENDSDSDDENEDPASRIAYLTALSRGELAMSSSSEDDDSSQSSNDEIDDEENEEDPVYGTPGVLDPTSKLLEEDEIEVSYEESPYLVATNLDWENLRAVDIFAILSSFVPPGAVKRVQVYQSDFGMERMAKDKVHGPTGIWRVSKTKRGATLENDDTEDEVDSDDRDSDDQRNEHPRSNNDEDVSDGEEDEEEDDASTAREEGNVLDESDFDPEKLRAYEASKLKYYFAVIEFGQSEHADIAYREVDGMEFEHSSSAIDLRTIPADQVPDVVNNRPMRDEATTIPSNYEPPDFIVSALQQTNVQCTWDQGDVERERKLTKYARGEWKNMSEADELQAYLASDASSDDDSDDEKANKGGKLRKLLGLDSGDEGNESSEKSSTESSDDDDEEEEGGKQMKFIPGAKSLEGKIRDKLNSKDAPKELTPWEKYQEKRKQKRKERRQLARNKRDGGDDSDGKEPDEKSDEEDNFFLEDDSKSNKKKLHESKDREASNKSGNQELELLLAGENEEEEARDYDIRGIQRMEKNKGKNLRGSRKRKEDKIAADVSGKDFKVDIRDSRFAAVLDGSDDRFGIDKTDPNFKDTSGMREILTEQTKRRSKKRRKSQHSNSVVAPNVSVENNSNSAGANALSAIVQKLKSRVSGTSQ